MRSTGEIEQQRRTGETATETTPPAPTRRALVRNSVIALALIVAAAGLSLAYGWHGVAVQQREWLPTRWLVTLAAHEPVPAQGRGPLMSELLRRIAERRLDGDEIMHALERCLAGSRSEPPGAAAWRRRYSDFVRVWRENGRRPWSERRQLYRVPLEIVASTPPIWPTDAPTAAHLSVIDRWPVGSVCRVRIDVPGTDVPIVALRTSLARGGRSLVVPIPAPAHDTKSIDLTIEIDLPADRIADGWADGWADPGGRAIDPDSSSIPWMMVQRETITISVGPRVALADAMRPVTNPAIGAGLETGFGTVYRWPEDPRQVAVLINAAPSASGVDETVAIGVILELLDGDVVRRRSRLWWLVGGGEATSSSWDPPLEDDEVVERALATENDGSESERWRLRITGCPTIAMRAFGQSDAMASMMTLPARHWSGTIEVPVAFEDRQGVRPERPWRMLEPTGVGLMRLRSDALPAAETDAELDSTTLDTDG